MNDFLLDFLKFFEEAVKWMEKLMELWARAMR